ncbi:MAG: hypothetical protein ACLUHE_08275 [Christensenellales bacterium]
MALKVTSAQLKAIFALSRKLGMDMEDLHGMAYRISGTDSLRTLSGREAGRMIEELKMRCGQPAIKVGGGAGERRKPSSGRYSGWTCELGWNDQPGTTARVYPAHVQGGRRAVPDSAAGERRHRRADCDARRRPGGAKGVKEGGG